MSTRSFPMMVLPVSKALELEEFPKHEDVKQHLVEWQPSMGNVAFFSHTWLSWTHPDGAHHPKWNLLRQLLNLAVEGKLEVWAHMNAASQQMFDKTAKKQRLHIPKAELQAALTGGFIWLDYASVPQEDREAQGRAIASLSSYVGEASYFFVLASA